VKLSINKVFKVAFEVYRQNFFAMFSLMASSVMFFVALLTAFDYFKIRHIDVVGVVWLMCCCTSSLWFMCVEAFLPAFKGSRIKFRDWFYQPEPDTLGMPGTISKKETQKAMSRFFRGELLLILLCAGPILILLIVFSILSLDLLSPLFIALSCILGFVGVVISSRYYFFDMEVLGVGLVLQSFRNSAKKVSGNVWKVFLLRSFVFLINIIWLLLWLVLIVVSEEMTSTTSMFAIMTSKIGIIGTIVSTIGISCTLPFSVLVAIHAHIQLSSPKLDSSETTIETVSQKLY
jgi:hypothetical protein